jgi:hypothetical protein
MTQFSSKCSVEEFHETVTHDYHTMLSKVCAYLMEKLPGAVIDARHEPGYCASIGVVSCASKYWDKVINVGLKRFAQEFNCGIKVSRQEGDEGMAVVYIDWRTSCTFKTMPWPSMPEMLKYKKEIPSLKSTPFILPSGEKDETR